MIISGWGNYPKTEATTHSFRNETELSELVALLPETIPMGNLRSYGDSALSSHVIDNRKRNYFHIFDRSEGLLTLDAGCLLSEVVEAFVPQGWFLKVTPGTKLITIGGAIASDVHGKNHHIEGCFSECVKSFWITLADGNSLRCSREENSSLFYATCGGMGLTGNITRAEIYLKPIKSKHIQQTLIKTRSLKQTFDAFETYRESTYSVAWIDCLAKGDSLGRSLLTVGEFGTDNDLNYSNKSQLAIPFNFPTFSLNKLSVSAFNFLYYEKVRAEKSQQVVSIDSFFYPLDAIGSWNRIYGKNGFVQYQLILPLAVSYDGLLEILKEIAKTGMASFLAVLKLYGKENKNLLSFPMEGYSLALDFKIQKGVFELLDKLDKIVVRLGGRVYLAKDARMSQETFEQSYSNIDAFRKLRKELNLEQKFNSLQSKRLGI